MGRRGLRGALLAVGLMAGLAAAEVPAADLSRWRAVRLGSTMAEVSRVTGAALVDSKTLHSRPGVVQELEWRPMLYSADGSSDAVQLVVFHSLDGILFRIVVTYDRAETEGLTVDDLVDAISAKYGEARRPPAAAAPLARSYQEQDELIAQWEDALCLVALSRSEFGPTYHLELNLIRVDERARQVAQEASRLDEREKPAREAAKLVTDNQAESAKLTKARLSNRAKFKP